MSRALRTLGTFAAATAAVVSVRRRRRTDAGTVVRKYYDAWSDGDADALRGLLADDYRGHLHTLAGTEEHDADGLAALLASHTDVFEQVEYDVCDLLRDDGRAAARIRMRAQHRETGKSAEIDGLVILELDGGRIAEEWSSWDYLGLAEQIGLAAVT
jgi:steroid delta-isomerase-like uncharacterized protein